MLNRKTINPLFFIFCLSIFSNALLNSQTKITIDSICVFKSKRAMQVFHYKALVQTFNIGLGRNSEGHKRFQGDGRTPEGLYFIQKKNSNSKFYKSLLISYPNFKDIFYAKTHKKNTGGDICIHGLPKGYIDEGVKNGMNDWTAGCIAIKNKDMDFIFEAVSEGIPILICP